MTTTLPTDPKMQWQGNRVWAPYSWSWAIAGVTTAVKDSEKASKLLSVHNFPEKYGGSALQLFIDFERTYFSTALRLDDSFCWDSWTIECVAALFFKGNWRGRVLKASETETGGQAATA